MNCSLLVFEIVVTIFQPHSQLLMSKINDNTVSVSPTLLIAVINNDTQS